MNTVYYSEPTSLFKEAHQFITVARKLFSFNRSPKQEPMVEHVVELSFDALDPILAKQLTEVEVQLGQLAKIQSELSHERMQMKYEMNALIQLVSASNIAKQTVATPPQFTKNLGQLKQNA